MHGLLVGINFFKVNNGNSNALCETKVNIKALEQPSWSLSGVSIVNSA